MHSITTGDILHVVGTFGAKTDYTVRLSIRMADEVDGSMLQEAVTKTQRRYPYFSLRMRKGENEYYYEDNPSPIVLHHTDDRISLNTEESNYHVWSVCYNEDRIHLDFYHGIADGTGMYMVLSTLLYYYCSERYGLDDHNGIRTLEDPICPEETIDPYDLLPDIDLSALKIPEMPPVFTLIEDGGMTPSDDTIVWDIEVSEGDFVRFSSANDASPGTMVSILLARAIDAVFPERSKVLMNGYVINGRPMLGALQSHHNCVTTVTFPYTDRVKAMPFDRQCTVHRGTTFIQSDAERVQKAMTASASRFRMIDQTVPALEGKKQAFGQMIKGATRRYTHIVSYVGKWKYEPLSPYIREFWTHVPGANGLLAELAAVNGKIFISLHQRFIEDVVVKEFIRQLDENGISHSIVQSGVNNTARFPEPEED